MGSIISIREFFLLFLGSIAKTSKSAVSDVLLLQVAGMMGKKKFFSRFYFIIFHDNVL